MSLLKLIFAFLILTFCFSNCKFPDYYIKNNKPDAAFKMASKKLNRKTHKTKFLQTLEYGFNIANERDVKLANELKKYDDLQTWKRIHRLNTDLLFRQNTIEPYLPLVSKEGYRPYFKLNDVKKWEEESFWKVTELYLKEIDDKIKIAQTGKKLKAREAHYLIKELEEEHGYNSEETKILFDSTYEMGLAYIYLNIFSDQDVWNAGNIYNWIINSNTRFNSDYWKVVHLFPDKRIDYDLVAEVNVYNTYVSGENVSSSCERFEKEVEVGKREVKDTAGNVTYEPIFETVTATVTTYELNKSARVNARVEIYDPKTNVIVRRKDICGTSAFCDKYSIISGDRRAVSGSFSCVRPSFPSDRNMLKTAAYRLPRDIKRQLKNVDVLE